MPDFSRERQIAGIIAGVDEVGRGPWAGPVIACAAIISRDAFPAALINLIDDSKKLSAKARQRICDLLIDLPGDIFCYNLGTASVDEIDLHNIRQATFLAMNRAIAGLSIQPTHCLIDGNALPIMAIPATWVVKGDTISLSIAAASIIAKVTRDKLMTNLAQEFPAYGWDTNAGYGTAIHQQGINTHGITIHHRKSFKPIKQIIMSAAS